MVEVHLGNGLPAFHIVGLPEASVKEAKDRVRSALENSQFGVQKFGGTSVGSIERIHQVAEHIIKAKTDNHFV